MLQLGRSLIACIAVVLPAVVGTNAGAGAETILYVDDDARSGGSGKSWADPIRFLQDALNAASKPGSEVTEIRIGQGTYRADQGAEQTPGDVNATFNVPGGLAMRGGYAVSILDSSADNTHSTGFWWLTGNHLTVDGFESTERIDIGPNPNEGGTGVASQRALDADVRNLTLVNTYDPDDLYVRVMFGTIGALITMMSPRHSTPVSSTQFSGQ